MDQNGPRGSPSRSETRGRGRWKPGGWGASRAAEREPADAPTPSPSIRTALDAYRHRLEELRARSAPSYFSREARAIMAIMSEDGHGQDEWRFMRERHHLGDAQIRALRRQVRAFKDSHDDMDFTPSLLSTIRARTLLVGNDRDPLYLLKSFGKTHRAIADSAL